MSVAIRVLLAEDQPIVRAGFRALLDAETDLEVVGEAADGRQAVSLAGELRPDLVLMDIQMPGLDGLDATRQIRAEHTLQMTRVLILTTFELDEFVFAALRAGADGFLLKGGRPDELLTAIRAVAEGESQLAPSITKRLIKAYVSQYQHEVPPVPPGLVELSTRELEVLGLVARGQTNSEIAKALYLSPLTIKTHVSRILMKLRARDRGQLIVIAYQAGLISP